MKKIIAVFMTLVMLFSLSSCDDYVDTNELTEENSKTNDGTTDGNLLAQSTSKLNLNEREVLERDYYCNPEGAQTVTVLLYLCASDLESDGGCATTDINEILYADIGENVNIIVETGGTTDWQNSVIGTQNARYQLNSEGLILLDDTLGDRDMTDPETLTSFIDYGVSNYPADRYMLILWDHGGGTVGGFAYDERFPNSESMTLAEIDQSLSTSSVYFDFIGFDACLMATIETAFVLEQYTDYMLASQMTEPGGGWYYTDWISTLSANPSISMPDLAQELIDDYIYYSVEDDFSAEATLSLLDLTKLPPVIDALEVFIESAQESLVNKNFAEISRARSDLSTSGTSIGFGKTRAIDQDYDHVDIVSFAESLSDYSGSQNLINAVEDLVVYESESRVVSRRNGVNLYFPYTNISLFSEMISLYDKIGFNSQYVEFLASFVSVMAGGQNSSSDFSVGFGSSNNFSGEDDDNDSDWWSDSEWLDDSLYESYSEDYYTQNSYSDEELEIWDKNGDWVLSLNDEDWDLITTIEMVVLYDDGEGYIDLGSDNLYEFDSDGDLLITFDNTWVSLDGQLVAFYFESEELYTDGTWSSYGYVPAYINDEYAEIIVKWDSEIPSGYVAGYRVNYDSLVSQKGLFQFEDGDTIEYLCNYYDYDLYYDDSYSFGETLYFDGELSVSYEDIGYGECLVYYCLTDIYGNTYFTESLIFQN